MARATSAMRDRRPGPAFPGPNEATAHMAVSKEKRRRRRRMRALQSESAWLQKALFALRKAEAASEDAAEAVEAEAEDYELRVAGEPLPLEALESALQDRAEALMATTKEMRRALV